MAVPVGLEFPTGFEKGVPKVDIIDHDNEIEVQAALPGVKNEDLDVTINNQTITIKQAQNHLDKIILILLVTAFRTVLIMND